GGSPGAGARSPGGGGGPPPGVLPPRLLRLAGAGNQAPGPGPVRTEQKPAGGAVPPGARAGGGLLHSARRGGPPAPAEALAAADALASEAAANGTLARLAPCADPSTGLACAKAFIQSFGAAAYRRPLTDAEVSDLAALYTAGADGATYMDGIGLVVRGALQS